MSRDPKEDTPSTLPQPPEPAQQETPARDEKKDTTAAIAENAAAAAPDTVEEKHTFTKPAGPSKGEKVYRWVNYTGIGYFANLLVSLAVWDFFLAGKGRPAMDKAGRGFAKMFEATGMDAAKAAHHGAVAAKMGASPLGGHLTMIPLKIGEDHQRYITHKLNQALDPNYEFKDLKADWNTPEEDLPQLNKEATKQTWGQVALRRLMAWGAVTAAGTALGHKNSEALENWTLNKVNTGIDNYGPQGLKNFANTNDTFKRYTKLAALDSYFTVITSMVAYLTNTMFGKARDGDKVDILKDDVLLPSNLDEALTPPPFDVFSSHSPTARPASHVDRLAAARPAEPVEPAKRHSVEKHDKYTDIVAADKSASNGSPTLAV